MVEMAPLLTLARDRGIVVVEDCAQACGATYGGQRAGSLGDAGAFSFYPTKILGAFGDGGLITTSCTELENRLRRLRFYGMEAGYYSEEEGYNYRLDEVQAALLNHRLPVVDAAVERRRRLAGIYDEGLNAVGDLLLPVEKEGRRHQYYLYTIRTAHRDALMQFLRERGIETKINYPTPVHLMRGYSFLGYRKGDLPVTERLAAEILSLPMYPGMPEENALVVIAAIQGYFETISTRRSV
jgi:dTDP-4-amino-4,6-dideoxygalactose transaminase